jgi:hypothetical protein
MATLPATGSQISFGQVNQAFTNYVPNSAGNSPSGGQNIKLSAALGVNFAVPSSTFPSTYSTGTQISLSKTFGGRNTPYGY